MIDAHPPTHEAMAAATARVVEGDGYTDQARTLAQSMLAQWPPPTHDTHVFVFDGLPIALHLVVNSWPEGLRSLVGAFDVIALHGAPSSREAKAWDRKDFDAIARLATPDAVVVALAPVPGLQQGVLQAGFEPITVLPYWGARRAVRGPRHDRLARLGPRRTIEHVAVIGGGLAGAHVANALARRGIRCTVIDRHGAPASEASGGSAGIFHGTVHVGDGTHARLFRAAALHAARSHRCAIDAGVPGAIDGLVRLTDESLAALHQVASLSSLPTDWARVLQASDVAPILGVECHRHAWLFPEGGWIDPRALVHWLLAHPAVRFEGGVDVQALVREDDVWRVVDREGRWVVQADAVVLTNAADAAKVWPHAAWSIQRTLGQSTHIPADCAGLIAPALPVSGSGYAITLGDGSVVCGASSHVDDPLGLAGDRSPRPRDAQDNLRKLNLLTGSTVNDACASTLGHHVAWRARTPDRLPLVGAVPARGHAFATDNLRHVAREPGLYVLSALGSRGLTLAPLMAEVVAASMLREPMPLALSLLDAVDAARHATRGRRAPTISAAPNGSKTATRSDTPAQP